MDVNEAINIIENNYSFKGHLLSSEAWQTLKAHCTQPTAHNIQSMPPCRWCGHTLGSDYVCINVECLHHGE